MLCRYGGEEFCLLMPETDEAGASRWAERTRVAISQAAIPVKSVALQVTASFGVAQRLGDTAAPERLMQLADEALSVAKQSGRNRVVRFSSLQEPLPQWLSGRQADGPFERGRGEGCHVHDRPLPSPPGHRATRGRALPPTAHQFRARRGR